MLIESEAFLLDTTQCISSIIARLVAIYNLVIIEHGAIFWQIYVANTQTHLLVIGIPNELKSRPHYNLPPIFRPPVISEKNRPGDEASISDELNYLLGIWGKSC